MLMATQLAKPRAWTSYLTLVISLSQYLPPYMTTSNYPSTWPSPHLYQPQPPFNSLPWSTYLTPPPYMPTYLNLYLPLYSPLYMPPSQHTPYLLLCLPPLLYQHPHLTISIIMSLPPYLPLYLALSINPHLFLSSYIYCPMYLHLYIPPSSFIPPLISDLPSSPH